MAVYIMRKTDKQFKQQVADLVGGEYTFLEPYQGATRKIRVRHNSCGYEYEVLPSNFLRGRRCPKCSNRLQKTPEQFKQEVHKLVGDEYTILTPYTNARTKLKVRHNKCGYEYFVTPNNFLGGNRCPKCYGSFIKSQDQFKREVYKQVGNDYAVLSEYKGAQKYILFKHNKCGYIYKVKPSNFLAGSRCPKCTHSLTMTPTRYKSEFISLVGNEYTMLNSYKDPKTMIKVQHNKCGYVYKVKPYNFLSGNRCPKCAGNLKKTPEQFRKEFSKLVGTEYILLSDYINSSSKIKVRHNECGYEYYVEARAFMQGARCPKCNGGVKKTPEQFEKEFNQLSKGEYTLLSTYKGSHAKIKVRHNKCNYEYWIEAGSFLQRKSCPKCSHRMRITTEMFKKKVADLVGDEYTVLGEYVNNYTKILLKHNVCNRVISIRPSDFRRGQRCKWCYQHGSSHGNDYIARILKKYGVKYIREYKFDGCRDKRKLPFDFYLPDLNTCIEYDGKQHTDKTTKFYSEDIVRHDHIKDKFCKDNGIRLIRIPYTVKGKKAIEQYLKDKGIID